eukprot:2609630-Rhodomonas_salina.1
MSVVGDLLAVASMRDRQMIRRSKKTEYLLGLVDLGHDRNCPLVHGIPVLLGNFSGVKERCDEAHARSSALEHELNVVLVNTR